VVNFNIITFKLTTFISTFCSTLILSNLKPSTYTVYTYRPSLVPWTNNYVLTYLDISTYLETLHGIVAWPSLVLAQPLTYLETQDLP
jgi:hypothetical protein